MLRVALMRGPSCFNATTDVEPGSFPPALEPGQWSARFTMSIPIRATDAITMANDDNDIPEIATQIPVVVPETFRLFRLTPATDDLAPPHRQSAIVAAENEQQA